jgi:hypothetical protein
MSLPARIAIAVFLIFMEIYTVSYGVWNWKNRNKPGAVMVFVVGLLAVLLPMYMLFFRT